MNGSIRTGSDRDVDPCVDLWTRTIAARDGTAISPTVADRAREAFTQPIVRFAVVGAAGVGPTISGAAAVGPAGVGAAGAGAAVEARTTSREPGAGPAAKGTAAGESTLEAFALTITRRPGIALLSRLSVDPSAASRGLGSALVADAIVHARTAGFARLDLDVRITNTRAIALYERAGFAAVSEPWTHDAGDPLVTWSRALHAEGAAH